MVQLSCPYMTTGKTIAYQSLFGASVCVCVCMRESVSVCLHTANTCLKKKFKNILKFEHIWWLCE